MNTKIIKKLVPVIISGGSGSRLWPLSRKELPKPFIPLFAEENLFDKTLQRISDLKTEKLLIITNQDFYYLHKQGLKKAGFSEKDCFFLLEPEGRNTAPAILMAAQWIKKNLGEDYLMLVLPADHLVIDTQSFKQKAYHAAKQAHQKGLVTFGIEPFYPETGYGYIHFKKEKIFSDINPVIEFVEKPDYETAQKYIELKTYLWNSGMFCFSVKNILKAFQKYQSIMLSLSNDCLQNSVAFDKQQDAILFDKNTFDQFESISIDYAIMEKNEETFVVISNFDWSDIGSWKSASECFPEDSHGNSLVGSYTAIETKNTFLYAPNRYYGLIGLDNLTIVESNDAVLIADLNKTQEVKNIFQKLKEAKHPSTIYANEVNYDWGKKTRLHTNDPEINKLEILPQKIYEFDYDVPTQLISLHKEDIKISMVNQEKKLKMNEAIFLPPGSKGSCSHKKKDKIILLEIKLSL